MQRLSEEADASSDEEFLDAPGDMSTISLETSTFPEQTSVESQDEEEGMSRRGEAWATEPRVLLLVLHGNGQEPKFTGALGARSSSRDRAPFVTESRFGRSGSGAAAQAGGAEARCAHKDALSLHSAIDAVSRAHFPAAVGRVSVRAVPCPPICASAFAILTQLSPHGSDASCEPSSSAPASLSVLPLLATSSPQYQEAVSTLIHRINLAHRAFLSSSEGTAFQGKVCLVGDGVGGIMGFDALCWSKRAPGDSWDSSRQGSFKSSSDSNPASPAGEPLSCPHGHQTRGSPLASSRGLSRSEQELLVNMSDLPPCRLERKRAGPCVALGHLHLHQASLASVHGCFTRDEVETRRWSSSSATDSAPAPPRLDFPVSDFFLLGSPLALVLTLRRLALPSNSLSQLRPACQQIYNIFHPADLSACRLEPLFDQRLTQIPPHRVPRYPSLQMVERHSTLMASAIQRYFAEEAAQVGDVQHNLARTTFEALPEATRQCLAKEHSPMPAAIFTTADISGILSRWWGVKRIDYWLHCPEAVRPFPAVSSAQLSHTSYLESMDVAAFLLQQVLGPGRVGATQQMSQDGSSSPCKPLEKWLKKRTSVKIRNVTANHRANDVIVVEGSAQSLAGRFMYGTLDMVTLTGEKVDMFIMTKPPEGEWVYFDTQVTNSSGRVSYVIPDIQHIGIGLYPVKMVVRGDRTFADSFLAVLPKGTECVVFSIDGSFAASVSLTGTDPKVRPGAIDVVRHWQELGFLLIYVTGRPDMQKQRVVAWLAQHNFPHGLMSFCDGLVHDPLRHKTNFLRSLQQEAHMRIHTSYGSSKDIGVYHALGLSPSQIYIVGRPSKKHHLQCQYISEGYAAHLVQLECSSISRPAQVNARVQHHARALDLAGHGTRPSRPLPPCEAAGCAHAAERAHSQSEPEADPERRQHGQRSMSVTVSHVEH
nr:membrane-associated phosphatidylinositol transfer protein 2-like isoform X2 [Petromyzon marinus]